MSYRVIGDCGSCGGQVTVPMIWLGVIPPEPACQSCGKKAVGHKRKIIPMKNNSVGDIVDGVVDIALSPLSNLGKLF